MVRMPAPTRGKRPDMTAPKLERREYDLVPPSVDPGVFRCARCHRQMLPGYPFVPVRRDITHDPKTVGGAPVLDTLCVYCDETAGLAEP